MMFEPSAFARPMQRRYLAALSTAFSPSSLSSPALLNFRAKSVCRAPTGSFLLSCNHYYERNRVHEHITTAHPERARAKAEGSDNQHDVAEYQREVNIRDIQVALPHEPGGRWASANSMSGSRPN
jgi:hypothetical protein